MFKQLKKFTVNLLAGANIVIVATMLLTAYSDHINPAQHPILACAGMAFPAFLIVNMAFLLFWIAFKWTRVWIPLAGFVMAYPAIHVYMPLNTSGDTAEATLKVVSYNVCAYGGNYKYDDGFKVVYDYLDGQKADIVCLQEDADSWRQYVMQHYEKIYPYNDTTVFINTELAMNGVGIHTRFPILRKERIKYNSEVHGSVAYFLKTDHDTLLVINNHLEGTNLTDEDRMRYRELLNGDMQRDTAKAESRLIINKLGAAMAKRAPQAEAVREYIEQHRQYPVIVCGDFNDTPISYSRRTISQGLTDCFVASGRGIGLSFIQKGFYIRIDHLMCSEDFEPLRCEIDNKFDGSDHYPLVCWLKKRQKH